MKIQPLGHSCFMLEESTGTTVVTDPYHPSKRLGAEEKTVSAVTLSHGGLRRADVGEGVKVIDTVGFWEIDGVYISSVIGAANADGEATNLIFKYRMDGVDVCHLGDIGIECTATLAEAIGDVNVLMVPLGREGNINAEQAKEYVDFLMPDIVIPMYGESKSDESQLDEFLELFDDDDVLRTRSSAIELDRDYFDGESSKVLVFRESGD